MKKYIGRTEPIKYRMDWSSGDEHKEMRQRVVAIIHGACTRRVEVTLKGRHRSSAEMRRDKAWQVAQIIGKQWRIQSDSEILRPSTLGISWVTYKNKKSWDGTWIWAGHRLIQSNAKLPMTHRTGLQFVSTYCTSLFLEPSVSHNMP